MILSSVQALPMTIYHTGCRSSVCWVPKWWYRSLGPYSMASSVIAIPSASLTCPPGLRAPATITDIIQPQASLISPSPRKSSHWCGLNFLPDGTYVICCIAAVLWGPFVFNIGQKSTLAVPLVRLDKSRHWCIFWHKIKDHMHEKINNAYMMLGLINRNFKHYVYSHFCSII